MAKEAKPSKESSRASKRRKKAAAEDILSGLPVKCTVHDYDRPEHKDANLREDWWVEDREELVDEAMEFVDPGGEVSFDLDVDEEKARRMLLSRGWVDVGHFLPNEDERLDEESPGGASEVGWNVTIFYGRVSFERALRLVDTIIGRLGDEDEPYDVSALPADVSALRQRVCDLLNNHSQKASFRYAKCEYLYNHTDYPSGGIHDSLMWLTSDNRRVELAGARDYDSC